METKRLINLPFEITPLPGALRMEVPSERLQAVLSPGCLSMLRNRARELQLQIQIACNGAIAASIGEPNIPKPHPEEPDLYGQYDLPFQPTVEQAEQFIATMQAEDKIVTMLDLSLDVPRFVRCTPNQAWERNSGGGAWSLADWYSPDKFLYIWKESMVPGSRRRISERYTLQAMEERLDPDAGNIALNKHHYCCTAPNGDVRLFESDVRLVLLPFGPNPNDLHLIRMMVSDTKEKNPGAWEVLIPAAN